MSLIFRQFSVSCYHYTSSDSICKDENENSDIENPYGGHRNNFPKNLKKSIDKRRQA